MRFSIYVSELPPELQPQFLATRNHKIWSMHGTIYVTHVYHWINSVSLLALRCMDRKRLTIDPAIADLRIHMRRSIYVAELPPELRPQLLRTRNHNVAAHRMIYVTHVYHWADPTSLTRPQAYPS